MRELVLMRRGSEEMNVPSEKVQEYLDDGWLEVSRKPLEPSPVAVETPPLDLESDEESPPAPKGKAPKGKGS